jgi:hypothetical protein
VARRRKARGEVMPYVEVEVSLYDFDTEDLVKELKNRGHYEQQDLDSDLLYKIRSAYILEKPEQFRKTLEKILDENGMRV